ncbi:virulence factor TspB C-terminal domain-related protein [Neisseria polysaccharea]|uniref:virulence factor TspB C-terminal domain-related protein n=1 Tax=Neisseria polysaccharea TaxID=489 RepID=UPI0027299D49|nr:virulence factor TspB C-terminal domain-related protein [Neisseria polysaccharea]
MKFKRMVAAFVMSAFFISYANAENDQTYISEVGSGVRFVSRGSKVFDYLNGKPIGEVLYGRDLNTGKILNSFHKIGCFYTYCMVYKNQVSSPDKIKDDFKVFDISDLNLKEPDQEDADDLGMTLADYKKMIQEDNDYGRIWQKIQLKKAEQLQKEKEEEARRKGKRKVFVDYRGHRFKSVKELCYDVYKGLTYGRGWNGSYQHIEVKGVDAGLYENNKQLGRCNAVWPDGKVANTLDYSVLYEDIPEGEKPEEEKKEPEKDHPKPVEKPDASNPKPSENPNVGTLGGGASPAVGNAPGGGSLGASDGGGSTGAGNGGDNGLTSQGSGKGKGDGEDSEKMPDVPKYGEPDWGSIKSDGNFGIFSPANVFSTGGHCMSDIRLDMGQFGNHTLQMGFLCDFLKKLRYVFIAMAYLYSAVLVFKTVNSLKG